MLFLFQTWAVYEKFVISFKCKMTEKGSVKILLYRIVINKRFVNKIK